MSRSMDNMSQQYRNLRYFTTTDGERLYHVFKRFFSIFLQRFCIYGTVGERRGQCGRCVVAGGDLNRPVRPVPTDLEASNS